MSSSSPSASVPRRAVRRIRRLAAGAEAPDPRPGELERLRDEVAQLEDRLAAERRKVMQMAYAYRGLHAAVTKTDVKQLGKPKGRPLTDDERRGPEAAARTNQHLALFAAELGEGGSLPGAMARMVRNGGRGDRSVLTRQVAQALQELGARPDAGPTVAHAGAIGVGLLAHDLGLSSYAWDNLSTLPAEVWIEQVPGEFLELAAHHAPERLPSIVAAVLAEGADLAPEHWLELVRIATGLGLTEHLADLQDRFDARAGDAPAWAEDRAWLDRWVPRVLAATDGAPTPALAPGEVAIGVMTYAQPDLSRTSTNIGDFVQTVASLSHVVRHSGVRFDDSELGRFAAGLADRVPDSLRVESPAEHRVRLFEVDRDASHLAEIPDGTWLLGFGWYAHTIGGVRHEFPFDPRVRPLYVSFHVNRRSMLTEEAVDHLRRHAPIGCRDWSTVDLLLSLDIPAFFSGCLTTTVRYVQPDDQPRPGADAPVVYVDVEPPGARDDGLPVGPRVRNERPEVAVRPAGENLRDALEILDGYATEAGLLVTKRLHCYLPARALGRPVEFVPGNPADLRFNGLAPLTDAEVHAMGADLADLLEPVVAQILAGADEATVRSTWSEVTAELVAEAALRRTRQVDLPVPFDPDAAVRAVHAGRVRVPASTPTVAGEPIDVVLALDGNLKEQFPVVVDSLSRHASRPLRLHVLCRDHSAADFDRVAALFGEVEFDWLPCDAVDHGEVRSMLAHITVSTMDRLLLPLLLPEVERVLYHDIDALPVADVVPLFEIDLAGTPLAARDAEASLFASGFSNVYLPARSLADRPEQAFELVRREFARHPYDYVGLNAGVLVLDLARMRTDDFCARFLPYVSEYGMHDQNVLNCYVGADRVRLDPEWNARPSQERVGDARIVHWAGGQKPWEPGFIAAREVWEAAEAELTRRRADLRVR